MDRARLTAIVYKKTGVMMDADDPAFVIAEVVRVIVDELVSRLLEQVATVPEQIRSSAKAFASEVGVQALQRVVESLQQARQTIAGDVEKAEQRIPESVSRAADSIARQVVALVRASVPTPRSRAVRARWVLAGAVAIVVLCGGSFAAGWAAATASVDQPSTRRQ
jgi:hypothetical protein